MILPTKPFVVADRYITLHKIYSPKSWSELLNLFIDMIVMPIITIFLFTIGSADPLMVVSTAMKAYQSWRDYTEYIDLRYQVQLMFLYCQTVGGPFITTNDSLYMPYVFADAVQRKYIDKSV